ncbi:MAG: hypothetical protein HY082_05965 [Gammaproteobacteria bacterium]|nr:hypothetical protein [Gammaproteobacteria bacterium]
MEQIELSDFIRNALVQIAKGVREANKELQNPEKNQFTVFNLHHNVGDSSKKPGVKFDVAVTAASGQKDKAGFFVALVNIGGGANTEKSKEGEVVHRIQFEVGIETTWL